MENKLNKHPIVALDKRNVIPAQRHERHSIVALNEVRNIIMGIVTSNSGFG